MNHRIYLLPSVHLCGSMHTLEHGGHPLLQHACIHSDGCTCTHSTACPYAYKWPHVLIQRVRHMDTHTHTHTQRSGVKCSITGGAISLCLSLSWCWRCRLCCLCGCHPPTHLCPSGPSGPESIWHLPLCLSSCHLWRPPPAALTRQHFCSDGVTEKKVLNAVTSASTQWFTLQIYTFKIHSRNT